MTDDLLTFLRQQLDDDERAAIETGASDHPAWRVVVTDEPSSPTPVQAAHIERHGPWRVLRRVAADRRILDEILKYEAAIDGEWGDGHTAEQIAAGLCPETDPDEIPALRLLALPYANRPGYRSEWAP